MACGSSLAAWRALALGLGKVPGPDRLLIEVGERVEKVREKAEPEEPPASAPMIEKMRYRLKTKKGRAIYKSRKETVEPTFRGISAVGVQPSPFYGL